MKFEVLIIFLKTGQIIRYISFYSSSPSMLFEYIFQADISLFDSSVWKKIVYFLKTGMIQR